MYKLISGADSGVVAGVEHAEGHFHAHELFESTIEAKPIKITRKDIYGMLSALIQHVDVLVCIYIRSRLHTELADNSARLMEVKRIRLFLFWKSWKVHL